MSESDCWLCLRITPKMLAKSIHGIFENPPHALLVDAVSYIERAYEKNRFVFCGKKAKCVVGGLLYLLGNKYGYTVTQSRVGLYFTPSYVLNCDVTVRKGMKIWAKLFPELKIFYADRNYLWRVRSNRVYEVLYLAGVPLRFNEISRRTGFFKATLSFYLKRLVKSGKVKRVEKANQWVEYSC